MKFRHIVYGLCLFSLVAVSPVAGVSDPQEDTIGWENGYWYNETLPDEPDRLAHLERLTDRAIARVERLVGTEFTADISTQVQSRQDVPDNLGGRHSAERSAWDNQLWEALFVAGEETNATEVLSDTIRQQTRGYYSAEDDTLVIVTENASTVPERTLIHELTHAMQDNTYDITSPRYTPETHTAQLGAQSVIEGHAVLTTRAFRAQCRTGRISCQEGQSIDTAPPTNLALMRIVAFPYVFGPAYVSDNTLSPSAEFASVQSVSDSASEVAGVEERGTVSPITVVPNDARVTDYGENGADKVGSPTVSVMFWNATASNRRQETVRDSIYRHDVATGLVSSRLVPYKTDNKITGYVWKLRWTSEADAKRFTREYTQLLQTYDARQTENGQWRVDDGGFADWFDIEQDNQTVIITNAPSKTRLTSILGSGRMSPDWKTLGAFVSAVAAFGALLTFSDTFVIKHRILRMNIVHRIMHKMGVCECNGIKRPDDEPGDELDDDPNDEAKTDEQNSE